MHTTKTASLAMVRRKGGMNGKRLSILLVMHWKIFELQKQCARIISPIK
jgi:hypothetical protein